MKAEQTLQEFRCSAEPYESCKYILENSKDPLAQFHAIAAIRDASIREWDSVLNPEYRIFIIQYLLSKSLENVENVSALVVRQLGSCTATLLKRIWGDLEKYERESVLSRIANMTLQEHSSLSAKSGAVELMRAVVTEFNPYTSSQLGLPLEYHYECKKDLELNFLPTILQWALSCAHLACEHNNIGLECALCTSSLSLISALLLWDTSNVENYGRISDINIQVRPPEIWREILFGASTGETVWPLHFLNQLSSGIRTGHFKDDALRASYFQVLNNLASMHGHIFLNDNGRSLITESRYSVPEHLRNIFHLFLPDLVTLETISASSCNLHDLGSQEEMILGACRALGLIAATHPLKDIVHAMELGELGGFPKPERIFQTISNCTINLLSLSKGGNDVVEDCAQMMMETWVEFSTAYDLRSCLRNLYEPFCSCQGIVFQSFTHKKLYEVCLDVYSDEEDFEGEEEAYSDSLLSGLACIGRCSHRCSLPFLIEYFEGSKRKLQLAVSEGLDLSVPLEELCWLLRISSYVLADTGEGETPLVPQIYVEEVFKCDVNENLVVRLSKIILNLAMDLRTSIGTLVTSSRLMEELCKALGRWSDSYLLPECKSVDFQIEWNGYIFTSMVEGVSVLNLLVELATLCFAKFPGDRTLHLCACQNLLKPIIKYEKVRELLTQTTAWQDLMKNYEQDLDFVKALEGEVQIHLTTAICTGVHSQEYTSKIVNWQINKVSLCVSLPRTEFHAPEIITRTYNALSSLRGVARSSCVKSHTIMFHAIKNIFPVCLEILELSKDHMTIYNNVLELAADIVEYHGPFLSDDQSRALFSWVIEIIRMHAANKIIHHVKDALLTCTIFEDECDALVSLIRLLTQVTNAETCRHENIATTVFLGVESVMPLLTVEHLKVPAVRKSFFTLFGYIIEVYTSKIMDLSSESLASFMEAIAFGVEIQDDPETSSAVFEAIAALSRYSILSRSKNCSSVAANDHTQIEGKAPLLFLYDKIMSRILYDDSSWNTIDLASEPVLYLMAHDPGLYIQFLEGILLRNPIINLTMQQKATMALEELNTGVLSSLSLDRPARNTFRSVFKSSVFKLRSVVKKR